MPNLMPLAKDVHVNKMLTDILVGYHNSDYIADQIFPPVMVGKQSDIIPAINKSAFFRDEAATPLGETSEAGDIGYTVDTSATYYALRYGIKHFISDDRRANEDDPFDSDREAAMLVTNAMRLRRERSFVANHWTTSRWTTDVTGGSTVTKWSDYGTSTPIENIRTYKRTIRRLLGREPNLLVLGDLTADRLLDHPDVLDRIKYTERGIASTELLAALFGVDRVLVGKSVYTASAEGTAEGSVTYTANWDDRALLLYVPSSPSIWEPAAGYTFFWNTSIGNGMETIRKYRDDKLMGDYIEVRSYYDQKLLVPQAGVYFHDIVD
jgi:hypothetical protein